MLNQYINDCIYIFFRSFQKYFKLIFYILKHISKFFLNLFQFLDPARVTFSPTIQYLPLGLSGVIRCYVQASPPFQFITWTKESRQYDPNAIPGVVTLNNGSLLFQRVTLEDQGRYRCTPYNIHGTAGTSNIMDVLVRGKIFSVKQLLNTFLLTNLFLVLNVN